MKIGKVDIENNIFLAPMAGITDLAFRRICRRWGAGMTYTEMVSAKGLYYNDKKTAELLMRDNDETPSAAQIFGSEPEIMYAAVPKALKFGADILDINMGCPAPKIVNNLDGSALMRDEKLAAMVIRRTVDAAKDVPVTVKMRAGWDKEHINVVELAKIAEENGAAAVTVHPRTRDMFYSGSADWDLIGKVKKAVRIPVIGSGDIFSAKDAIDMIEKTGCDAVMIARGAQGNPFIFRQIKELLENGKVEFKVTPKQRIEAALVHADEICKLKGEVRGIREARKHLAWYIKEIPSASVMRQELFKVTTLFEAHQILEGWLQKVI